MSKASKANKSKTSKATKVAKPQAKPQTTILDNPYSGRVYGPVFAYSIKQEALPTRLLIEKAAKATNLPEQDVRFCIAVLRQPAHPTNRGWAKDICGIRGVTQIRRDSGTVKPAAKAVAKPTTAKATLKAAPKAKAKAKATAPKGKAA